ncbi:1,2-dihydroxy-3-keto-5-methylthiopentene dioxygenase [Allomyces arbusculus]|nr:1,2-dihydroxy-3-keto-5-methylthiopentene dioxygenase [Allomyces arbusculus]
MVRIYYYDNDTTTDPRAPHVLAGHADLTERDLATTGVLYWRVPIAADGRAHLTEIDRISAERGYKNRDQICVAPGRLPEYETKIKSFFDEHLHEDEEIRYILGGSGFFDVRDSQDRWVRVAVEAGDLLVLPAGIYHRFTTDEKNYIEAMRLFKDEPKWTPLSRSIPATDKVPSRAEYLAAIAPASH